MNLVDAWLSGNKSAGALLGDIPRLSSLYRKEHAPNLDATLKALDRIDSTLPRDESRSVAREKLAAGASVIISGQQPGLFGGPVLVALKIAASIRLAEAVEASGQPCVAVFWNASEDHDLAEANRLFLRNKQKTETELHHLAIQGDHQPLERIVVDDAAIEELRALIDSSGERPFSDQFFPKSNEDLGRWMSRVWAERFQGRGLLIFEPRDARANTEDFRRELHEREVELRRLWMERRTQIKELGFAPHFEDLDDEQSLSLWLDQSGRRRLSRSDDRWRESSAAEHLSPSALLRPALQQHLFPVLSQVSGRSEMAYLAECFPLFDALGLARPQAWPRPQAFLLEESEHHHGDSQDLQDEDLVNESSHWPALAMGDEARALDAGRRHFAESFGRFRNEHDETFTTGSLPAEWEKLTTRFQKDTDDRLLRVIKRIDKDQRSRRRRLEEAIYPRGRPQERLRSLCCYDHHDPSFVINALLDAIPLDPLSKTSIIRLSRT